jgi:hypothetical protein
MKTVMLTKKFKRVPAKEKGLVRCPGEAHTNPYIDHCMLCLRSKWGWMKEYEVITPAECMTGKAVAYTDSDVPAFIAAHAVGKVALVHMTQKFRGGTSNFLAWILASEVEEENVVPVV